MDTYIYLIIYFWKLLWVGRDIGEMKHGKEWQGYVQEQIF